MKMFLKALVVFLAIVPVGCTDGRQTSKLVEARVRVSAPAIKVLAMLEQLEFEDYVSIIIKSDRNLSPVLHLRCQTRGGVELTSKWLRDNVSVRGIDSGILGVGVKTDEITAETAKSVVNGIVIAFTATEPGRSKGEVARLIERWRAKLEEDPNDKQAARSYSMIRRVFSEESFEPRPTIVAMAKCSS